MQRIKKRVGKLGVKLHPRVTEPADQERWLRVQGAYPCSSNTQWLGSIVSISLPDLMPIDCIQRLSYFANMLIKTGPLASVALEILSACQVVYEEGDDTQKKDKETTTTHLSHSLLHSR